ncbi:hypothetical protein L2E82_33723 [Cichorium intybus]|uniref:Uncharacterized protein n=1 Tax=Cichorium intybus TaxID=13427 RepID=A0ACB9BKY9_CICIN|nr:hypothetical protein L2E82_33723 [Cichorium intybus]
MVSTRRNDDAEVETPDLKDFVASEVEEIIQLLSPQFDGKKDPIVSTRWISEIKGAFRTSFSQRRPRRLFMNEITNKFMEKSVFFPECVATEKMKMFRYSSMFRVDIRKFVETTRCRSPNEMVDVARALKLDLETQDKKRKETQSQDQPYTKKIKQSGNEKDTPKCGKCGRYHLRECR